MIATTAERVSKNTSPAAAERILKRIQASVHYHQHHPEAILGRLEALDREWDIERTLETGSSSLTLLGLVLGTIRGRKWLLLSLGVQGFFLQHAIQGWCPPLPLLRALGVRTFEEIEAERSALYSILEEACRPDGKTQPNRVPAMS